jgi:hypothetical protein
MPDFSRGDIVALVAAQLLGPQGDPSPEAIDAAIKHALKIIKGAHAAVTPGKPAPKPKPDAQPGPHSITVPQHKTLAAQPEANKRIGRGRNP